MATIAPYSCPVCGASMFVGDWGPTQTYRQPLSAGKAIVGGILAGPVGAIAGAAMGKDFVVWSCKKCGFSDTYKKG